MHVSNPQDLDSTIHAKIADKIIAKPLPITIAHSANDVLALAQDKDIYISGGLGAYQTFLSLVDKLCLTFIEAEIDGDTFFPKIDFSQFTETERTFRPKDEKNIYDMSFVSYERKPH
jgi:dihydrofolate reductase